MACTSLRLNVETLEARETPAVFVGPLQGTITTSITQELNTIVQSVTWVGPNGQTFLAEDASVSINPLTGAVTGTVNVTGIAGNTSTGQLIGQLNGSTFTETTTFTGPNGQTWTQHGVYVGNGDGTGWTSNTSVTGPNGRTVTKSNAVTFDATTQTVTVTGSATAPNGRTVDWNRMLHI